ncbi:WxL domain-containing protein [Enterococcus sp. 5H]|uniref:WxL domain-containing protein n=1 Tax=Enterococcus sp. 5H TaxID=1229490 RepID=UPI0023035488|nr:WxL domain-containing protein [Enterococcus sp. 5H]MDA9472833.1 hypothetical protein [Enterococcus sp. 5H]
MKQLNNRVIGTFLFLVLSMTSYSSTVHASPTSVDQSGNVVVVGGESQPVDPENPESPENPGESPSTTGPLRIDFVSSLDFGRTKISETNRTYLAFAQQFLGKAGPRGSYIQITDQRTVSTGWTLQVKQEHQFRNRIIQEANEQQLEGAVLSLDKGWANSSGTSAPPTVTRETVALNANGAAHELAIASAESGRGVWTIAFGASETNSNNMVNTLSPAIDRSGNVVIDEFSGKPAYYNSAITLTIPNTTKIHPVQYETTLTWILAELP